MDNRSKLLAVALDLFSTHGYEAVGVQQIVEAAGVTKPTLYHYFQSKQGLFEALVADKAAPLLADLEEASRYRGDLVSSITDVFGFYFDYATREPAFYRLLLLTWFMPPSSEGYDSITRLQQAQFERIERLFMDATEHHGNMRGRHKQYAVSLRGTIDTYIGLSLRGNIQFDDFRIHRVVHQFMHGIFS